MVHKRTTISVRRLRTTTSRKPQTSSILHARHSNLFPPGAKPKRAGVTRKGRAHPRRSRWWVAATHSGRRRPVVAMSARTAAVKYLHGKPWYIAWVFRAPEGNRYEAIVKGERIMRRGVLTQLHKHELLGTNDQPPNASDVRQYEALGTRSSMVKRRSTLTTRRRRHSSSSSSSHRSSHSSGRSSHSSGRSSHSSRSHHSGSGTTRAKSSLKKRSLSHRSTARRTISRRRI